MCPNGPVFVSGRAMSKTGRSSTLVELMVYQKNKTFSNELFTYKFNRVFRDI